MLMIGVRGGAMYCVARVSLRATATWNNLESSHQSPANSLPRGTLDRMHSQSSQWPPAESLPRGIHS